MKNEYGSNQIDLSELGGFRFSDGIYTKEIKDHKENVSEIYTFKRVTDIEELKATTFLQQTAFEFENDRDVCPGHMLATLNKLGGIVIAGYNSKGEIATFVYNWPMVKDGRSDLLLLDMVGVRDDLKDSGVGGGAMMVTLIEASKQGIKEIQFTYDPLKVRNANLYLTKAGAKFIEYEEGPYGDEGLSGDRFLVSWKIDDPATVMSRMCQHSVKIDYDELNLPLITPENFPMETRLVLPAPENDENLTVEERVKWGEFYKNVAKSYFQTHSPTEFVSTTINGMHKNAYILEQKV